MSANRNSTCETGSEDDEIRHPVGISNYFINVENSQGPIYCSSCIQSTSSDEQGTQVTQENVKTPKLKSLCCEMNCGILKEKLIQLYQMCTLPVVAWLDDGYDLPIEDFFIQLQLLQTNESIRIDDIFNSVKNKQPLRIFIEGQPGYGKTTLATKLAYDWAAQRNYIKHFKLLFFLPLRELQQQSVEDAFVKIGQRCGYKMSENLTEIIKQHEKETIFIMDGLDELSLDQRNEVMKILYKQMYSDVTVVVLSRSGLFKMTKSERRQLFGEISIQNHFHDKQISILGIRSIEKKRQYLINFFPPKIVDDIILHLSSQLELFNSPLFLMMLTIIKNEDENFSSISNKTELYKKLFNSIIKNSCIKLGKTIDTDFNLFSFDSSTNPMQEIIYKFGILSQQKIIDNELQFENSDLTKQVYETGFLINHKQTMLFTSKNYFEAFHLSILEFSAAFSLWMDHKTRKSNFTEENLKPIVKKFIESRGTSLVLPFLASLMEDELDGLLCRIKSFDYIFLSDYDLTFKFLRECTPRNISKTSASLQALLPSEFDLRYRNFYSPLNVYRELLKCGSECGKIKLIRIDNDTTPKLFPSIISCSLSIEVCFNTVQLKAFSNLHCVKDDVFSYFQSDDEIGDECDVSNEIASYLPIKNLRLDWKQTLENCLLLVTSSNIESCSLILDSILSIKYFLKVTEELKLKINFRYFRYNILRDNEQKCVTKLLENNQVKFFQLTGNSKTKKLDVTAICKIVGTLPNPTSIYMSDVIVDLYQLTNGGIKKYDHMILQNCNFVFSSLFEFGSCQYLKINNEIDVVMPISFSSFECSIPEISAMINRNPKYTGFKNVENLILNLGNCWNYNELFYNLFNVSWENLHTLKLQLWYGYDEKMIVKFIENFGIERIIIDINEILVSSLLVHMKHSWSMKEGFHLKTIEIIHSNVNTYNRNQLNLDTTLLYLMNGLECKIWDKANIITPPNTWDSDIFYLNSVDFNVNHCKYGSNVDDPEQYKIGYNHQTGLNYYDVFSITRLCSEFLIN